MFEQDYLMRQIREYIAFMMKMLFGAELRSAEDLLAYQQSSGDDSDVLYRLIDAGQIQQAESVLYESMDAKTAANLLKGYAFYQYLAQKDDEFLEAHHYSRAMIAEGVRRLAALFGAGHLADLFLPELN